MQIPSVNSIIKVTLSILFFLCLLDWNYGFYQFVRFVGMIGFAYLSYQQYKKNDTWFYIWLVSATLINPIFKISLGRTLWNIIDVVWAGLLIYSIFFYKKRNIKTKKINTPKDEELTNNYLYKKEDEEFLDYHYKRLYYATPEELVSLYNREDIIGSTGENMQMLTLLILNRLFLRHFDASPISVIDDSIVKTNGQIYLSKNKFYYKRLKKV